MRPLLAYIGDDFTGSTDVMEVMQWAGYRTLLFLDVPTPKQLESFGDVQAFGVATRSRCWSPREMENELGQSSRSLRIFIPSFSTTKSVPQETPRRISVALERLWNWERKFVVPIPFRF